MLRSYSGKIRQSTVALLKRNTNRNYINKPVQQNAFYATKGTAKTIFLEQAKIPIETKQGITYKEMSIGIRNGIISQIGQLSSKEYDHKLNVGGKLVTPGFIDSHSHLFHPSRRSDEYVSRLSYKTTHQQGGGIMASFNEFRQSTVEGIVAINKPIIEQKIKNGVTTLELKTGYGGNIEHETKAIDAIDRLQDYFKDELVIKKTLLIHALPKEYAERRAEYIEMVCNEMIPALALQVDFFDVFCDDLAFTIDETEQMCNVAKQHDLPIKLHVDQFPSSKHELSGVELGVRLGAVSVDHLEYMTQNGLSALKSSNIVATILPTTAYSLGEQQAPVETLLDYNIPLAIASNTNPGSSLVVNPLEVMDMANKLYRMPIEDAYKGMTTYAAKAVGEHNSGQLKPGYDANILIWPEPINTIDDLVYFRQFGFEPIGKLVKSTYMNSDNLSLKVENKLQRPLNNSQQRVLDFIYSVDVSENGIIQSIPPYPKLDESLPRAPKVNSNLNKQQRQLALSNHLKYFDPADHELLKPEFEKELDDYGCILGLRFAPPSDISLQALPESSLPGINESKAMTHMILNNLNQDIAQFPLDLQTYGHGNVFNNWMQFHITLHFLKKLTNHQTLSMMSGHPAGLFPSSPQSPRAVISNGMMIPAYGAAEDFPVHRAIGNTLYGQMTAGSWMYIGPQGIVHGTIQTICMQMALHNPDNPGMEGKIFVTSGLGGMSGAQPKATTMAGGICLVAETNKHALDKRCKQGWLDEKYTSLEQLINRAMNAKANKEAISLGYYGNITELLSYLVEHHIQPDLISDQTSLHNAFGGGYTPHGYSYEQSIELMQSNPVSFKKALQNSLKEHVGYINKLVDRGARFFDYGNAFLLEAGKAQAPLRPEYKSYVQTSMGPELFDNGFGPFRWVCLSGEHEDLIKTDAIAKACLEKQRLTADRRIHAQLDGNIKWLEQADKNNMTVGSKARILYADYEGRQYIAKAFHTAIANGTLKGNVVLGRDHHDVSGTDSPERETADIYDGSNVTADMAIQNVIGTAARGATWVSIHNGGGCGIGQVINGGTGHVLDGTAESIEKATTMLKFDVGNGLVRRAKAGHENAIKTVEDIKHKDPGFVSFLVTEDGMLNNTK